MDEIFRVLTYIKNAPTPPRAHELLQELRDISSMAMEHFDEKIVPLLKVKMPSVQLSLPCLNETFSGGLLRLCVTMHLLPLSYFEVFV